MFGGQRLCADCAESRGVAAGEMLNDAYLLTIIGRGKVFRVEKLTFAGTLPSARMGHTMVPFGRKKALLYGGFDGTESLNSAFVFDLGSCVRPSLSLLSAPSLRPSVYSFPSIVFSPADRTESLRTCCFESLSAATSFSHCHHV